MDKTLQLRRISPQDLRPASQRFVEITDSNGGIDKIFRLFQFYAKFILPLIKNKNQTVVLKLASFLESFGAICALTRKMLRIGKYVNCYRNISGRLSKSTSDKEFNDVIKSLSDISNLIFVLLDHILLVNKLNAFKFDSLFIQKVDFSANLFWGAECVTTLIYDLVDYIKIKNGINKCKADLNKIENVDSGGKKQIYFLISEFQALTEKAGKLKHEQYKKTIDLTRCALDFPLILHFLSSGKIISSSQAGLIGVITSLISCYQRWNK